MIECEIYERTTQKNDTSDILKLEVERLEERLKFVKNLGLSAQISLLEKEKQFLTAKVNMESTGKYYPEISERQMNILRAFFPSDCSLGDYDIDIIPVEILETYREAEDIFDHIFVAFHKERPDPLLMAKEGGHYFLLARWGDGLSPWSFFVRNWAWQRCSDFIFLFVFSLCLLTPMIYSTFTVGFKYILISILSLFLALAMGYGRFLRSIIVKENPFKGIRKE